MNPKSYNYSKVQIHFSSEKASDGSLIRESVTVHISDNDPENAIKLYRELKQQIEGGSKGQAGPTAHVEAGFSPECPDHHIKLLMRTRRSDGGIFFGCPMYEGKGCQKTAQYSATKKINVGMPLAIS